MVKKYTSLLLDIYDTEKKEYFSEDDGWWNDASIEIINELLTDILGYSEYRSKSREFRVKQKKDAKGNLSEPMPYDDFPLTLKDRKHLVSIFNSISNNIENEVYVHFILDGYTNIVRKERDKYSFSDPPRPVHSYDCLMPQAISKTIYAKMVSAMEDEKAKSIFRHSYNCDNEIPFSTFHYKLYDIIHITNLGAYLLSLSPTEQPINRIPTTSYCEFKSFTSILRSILVSYHIMRGGFKSLVVCDNCDKLFIAEKTRIDKFCQISCKSEYSRKEDKRITECRERQRAWLRYWHLTYYNKGEVSRVQDSPEYILKADCSVCFQWVAKEVEKGKCEKMYEKNKRLIDKVRQNEDLNE